MDRKPRGLFITGSDTNVGKTHVAAIIARTLTAAGIRVGVYKPVASGCRWHGEMLVSDDALALWEAAGRPGELCHVCPQAFEAPLAPHLAARLMDKTVDERLLREGLAYWTERSDYVLVEGAGGLLSPISDHETVADLAHELGFPVLIVVRNRIGAIHQALSTLLVAQVHRGGLPVAGIVLNNATPEPADESAFTNLEEIRERANAPVLGVIDWCSVAAAATMPENPDWIALAGLKPPRPARVSSP